MGTMNKLLLTNARLINEGEIRDADVLIEGERISRVDASITAPDNATVIDVAGRYLMPGMIDDQVHFREPGMPAKGDLATESAAAAAGGITSFMDMPNVNPQTTSVQALRDKYALAAERCSANYGFYLGATNSNIEEVKALPVGEACGIKAFMGASTGDMLVDDPEALEKLFEHAPVMVVTHCEHSPTIWDNEARARAEFGENVPFERASGYSLGTGLSEVIEYGGRPGPASRCAAACTTPDDRYRDGAFLVGAPLRETHHGGSLCAPSVVRRVEL